MAHLADPEISLISGHAITAMRAVPISAGLFEVRARARKTWSDGLTGVALYELPTIVLASANTYDFIVLVVAKVAITVSDLLTVRQGSNTPFGH